MATRSFHQQVLDRTPRFIHSKSNSTQALVIGTMRGAIMRCVDTASDEEVCRKTIRDTFGEFLMLDYEQKTFVQALRGLTQRYYVLEAAYEEIRKFGSNK